MEGKVRGKILEGTSGGNFGDDGGGVHFDRMTWGIAASAFFRILNAVN